MDVLLNRESIPGLSWVYKGRYQWTGGALEQCDSSEVYFGQSGQRMTKKHASAVKQKC